MTVKVEKASKKEAREGTAPRARRRSLEPIEDDLETLQHDAAWHNLEVSTAELTPRSYQVRPGASAEGGDRT